MPNWHLQLTSGDMTKNRHRGDDPGYDPRVAFPWSDKKHHFGDKQSQNQRGSMDTLW